jgi:hypothetical protein
MQPVPIEAVRQPWRSGSLWAFVALGLLWLTPARPAAAQNDAWPVPQQRLGNFGFPYEPPLPGEPGVTAFRRPMLDGVPELNFRPRPCDELWLISSRELSGHADDPARLVCRMCGGDEWTTTSLDALLDSIAARPGMPTLITVHGHRTDEFWARRRGKQAYQALVGNRPEVPPTRLVVWAWPSEESPGSGPFRNFSEKEARTQVDGYWLGYFLSHLPADCDPVLLTYSLGTQVSLTGLSHLAGAGSGRDFRVLAIAPVMRCDWPHDNFESIAGPSAIRQLVIIRNEDDVALCAFRAWCRLNGYGGKADGTDVLARSVPASMQFDVAAVHGREHNFVGYVQLPVVAEQLDGLLYR